MPLFLRLGLIVLLLTLLSPSFIRAQDDPKISPQTRIQRLIIPFQSLETHGGPIVEATINDKKKATILIDTGANNIAVSRSLVKRLGLTPNKRQMPNGTIETVTLDAFRMGPMKMEAEVLVSDSPLFKDLKIDGIMGTNYMNHYAILFDFEKQVMHIMSPGTLTPEEVRAEGFESAGQPLTLVPPVGFYFTNAKIGEKEIPMLLDTGSPNTYIPASVSKIAGGRVIGEESIVNYAQRVKIRTLLLPEISVGNLTVKNIDCSTALGGKVPDAIIGMNILSRCRMLLDYPAKQVYFQQIESATPASLANQKKNIDNAIVGPTATGAWKVFSVKKGTIFDKAGIQAGDILVSINKKPLTKIIAPELIQIFKQSKKVQITVLRTEDTKEKQLDFTVTY